jgi:hypothetical protein
LLAPPSLAPKAIEAGGCLLHFPVMLFPLLLPLAFLVIVSKAVTVRTLILDLTMALTIGFALGYGVRELISRRRRQAERRRGGLDGGFWHT